MATGGIDFSAFMSEHARIEAEIQGAGYTATYVIGTCGRRRESGHFIGVFVTDSDIGTAIMKLLDFVESKEPKFGIRLLIFRAERAEPTLAFVPAKEDKNKK